MKNIADQVYNERDMLRKFVFIRPEYKEIADNGTLPLLTKGDGHDRPCYCALWSKNYNLYWAIPISSNITKYVDIYNRKLEIHGRCDTISFALVKGQRKAFLIQNIFPLPAEYIKNVYKDGEDDMSISQLKMHEIATKTQRVFSLEVHGKKILFSDVRSMLSDIDDKRRDMLLHVPRTNTIGIEEPCM